MHSTLGGYKLLELVLPTGGRQVTFSGAPDPHRRVIFLLHRSAPEGEGGRLNLMVIGGGREEAIHASKENPLRFYLPSPVSRMIFKRPATFGWVGHKKVLVSPDKMHAV